MDTSDDEKVEARWTCSRCGREFNQTQAAHDCRGRDRSEYAATTLFASSAPHIYDLFLRFAAMAAALGAMEVRVERMQIEFGDPKVFATVRAERAVMLVGLVFADLDNQPRFVSIEQQDDSSWLHTVRVSSDKDLNAELAGWLERAHREAVGING